MRTIKSVDEFRWLAALTTYEGLCPRIKPWHRVVPKKPYI